MTTKTESLDVRWNKTAADLLVGRRIVAASYMTEAEANETGWYSRPVILQLDNGQYVVPQSDDEGNNGGALTVGASILPTL